MKKNILGYLLILSLSQSVFAQQKKIDSLLQVLKISKEDTNKVKILNRIAFLYLQLPPNYQKALSFAEESGQLGEKLSYKRGTAVAYEFLGTIYGYFGLYEKVFENYLKELKIGETLNDSEMIIKSYQNLSFAYALQGTYKKALEIDLLMQNIAERAGNKEKIEAALWTLGGTYFNICKESVKQADSILANENYNRAIECKFRALESSIGRKDTNTIANLYINLGYFYDKCNACEESNLVRQTGLIKANYYQQAEEYFFTALTLYQKLKNRDGIVDSYSNLGRYYRNQGNLFNEIKKTGISLFNYKKSLAYYLLTLSIIQDLGYKHGIANFNKEVGIAYLKLSKLNEAEEYILKAAIGFKEIGFKEGSKECYEKLSQVSLAKGDYRKAFEYNKIYSLLKDSLLNEATTKQIAEMNIRYETDKKNAALSSQQRLTEKEKDNRNLAIILGAIIILSGSFTGIVLFRRKQTKHFLQTKQLENKVLRCQLNPHFVFNALNSIQGFIHDHPETAEDYLTKFSQLMREVLESSEKEHIYLEDEISMLKKYMELELIRVKNGFDNEITIDSSVEEEITKVPPLVLQPIVENAIWHGIAGRPGKGKISIHVRAEKKLLLCEIENHCEGTRPSGEEHQPHKRKSFGLQITRERISLLSKGKNIKGFLNMLPLQDGMKVQIGIPV